MAELNFGLLTPPGSQSIGNAFVSGMDQAAVARAQENQNALSQYTLGKARREDEQQNRLYQAIQDPNFKLDLRTAMQYGPQGMAALKAQTDAAAAEQERALKQSQITEREARLPGFIAEAYDKRIKPYASAAYNSTNVDDGVAAINAMYDDPPVAAILSKIKPREAAIQSAIDAFSDPKTRDQWRQYWGGITPEKLFAQTTISAGEQARLDQSKFQFENPSAYQQLQLDQSKKQHLENLAQQGWTFDTDRGIAVNARQGISRPISTLMAPVGGGFSTAPVVGGAPATSIAAPSIAASGGGVPGQRQAPAGQPVAGVLGPKPEKPIWNSEAQGFIYPPSQDNPSGKFVAVQGMEGKPLTEVQAKSALFGSAMQQANTVITEIGKKGTFTSAIVPGLLEGIVKLAPLGVGDAAANAIESAFRTDPTGLIGPNENQQRLAQAQLGFAIGYLRSTSGAAFGAQEVANTIKEYFPLQGESKIVIEQKSESRERAIQGMRLAAGKSGSDFINKYVPKVNTSPSKVPDVWVRDTSGNLVKQQVKQ